MSSILKTANGTRAAMFGEIGTVAREERQRMLGPDQDPLEIQLLRLQASDDARALIAEAYDQSVQIREDARQEGWQEGYEAGRECAAADAERRLNEERDSLRAAVQEFTDLIADQRRQMWRQAEEQVITFVLEIARKIIKDEARVNRDVVLSVVRNALRRVVETDGIRIRVSLEDLDAVRSSREELASLIDGVRGVEIVSDRRVAPGGCVIETNTGAIDSRIDTQIDEMGEALRLIISEAA